MHSSKPWYWALTSLTEMTEMSGVATGGDNLCPLLAFATTPPSWSPEQDRVLRAARHNAVAASVAATPTSSPSWKRRDSEQRCDPG